MHRDLSAVAALLGIPDRTLRQRLRSSGVLQHDGLLASRYREGCGLFVDTRSRWNRSINGWSHYGVVMATEQGVEWIADRLGKPISKQEVQEP